MLDDVSAATVTLARLGRGGRATARHEQPVGSPTLSELEASPCRREVISALELDVGACGSGSRHRAEVVEAGGRTMFPTLDPLR